MQNRFLYYVFASAILSLFNYIKNEKVGEKVKELRKESDKVAGLTSELVRGARDIKMLYAKESFIKNLKGNYTIIIIAHRLSTIVNCDKIFILEDGKISDSGSHKELLKNNKYYKKLCETELLEKKET